MATTISRFSITDLTQRFRWLWMINAFFMPWLALIGIIPALKTGNSAWLALGFIIFYVAIPVLDYVSGQDPNNHDEADVPALDADNYFRWALFVALAGTLVVWFSAIAYAWYAQLSILGLAALALSCMGLGGAFLNLGHELGHKKIGRNAGQPVLLSALRHSPISALSIIAATTAMSPRPTITPLHDWVKTFTALC